MKRQKPPSLPPDFYKPLTRREYLDLGDITELSSEEIAKRVCDLLDREDNPSSEENIDR